MSRAVAAIKVTASTRVTAMQSYLSYTYLVRGYDASAEQLVRPLLSIAIRSEQCAAYTMPTDFATIIVAPHRLMEVLLQGGCTVYDFDVTYPLRSS